MHHGQTNKRASKAYYMCDWCTKATHMKDRHSYELMDVCAYDTHKTAPISDGYTHEYLIHV